MSLVGSVLIRLLALWLSVCLLWGVAIVIHPTVGRTPAAAEVRAAVHNGIAIFGPVRNAKGILADPPPNYGVGGLAVYLTRFFISDRYLYDLPVTPNLRLFLLEYPQCHHPDRSQMFEPAVQQISYGSRAHLEYSAPFRWVPVRQRNSQ